MRYLLPLHITGFEFIRGETSFQLGRPCLFDKLPPSIQQTSCFSSPRFTPFSSTPTLAAPQAVHHSFHPDSPFEARSLFPLRLFSRILRKTTSPPRLHLPLGLDFFFYWHSTSPLATSNTTEWLQQQAFSPIVPSFFPSANSLIPLSRT